MNLNALDVRFTRRSNFNFCFLLFFLLRLRWRGCESMFLNQIGCRPWPPFVSFQWITGKMRKCFLVVIENVFVFVFKTAQDRMKWNEWIAANGCDDNALPMEWNEWRSTKSVSACMWLWPRQIFSWKKIHWRPSPITTRFSWNINCLCEICFLAFFAARKSSRKISGCGCGQWSNSIYRYIWWRQCVTDSLRLSSSINNKWFGLRVAALWTRTHRTRNKLTGYW